MDLCPKLNLPGIKLKAERRNGSVYVWDTLRRCWLLLTPEEWVRRHVVSYLMAGHNIPAVNICQEFPVSLGGAAQRADIVVLGNGQRPLLLVECKAPDVVIDASVLDQAVRYNSVLCARYLFLTNGMDHYFYSTYGDSRYTQLDSFPVLEL